MLWAIVSVIVAVVLSLAGVVVSSYPFDIFEKVLFWLAVYIFFHVEAMHLFHVARVRNGG